MTLIEQQIIALLEHKGTRLPYFATDQKYVLLAFTTASSHIHTALFMLLQGCWKHKLEPSYINWEKNLCPSAESCKIILSCSEMMVWKPIQNARNC
jgi:hypothetical protein